MRRLFYLSFLSLSGLLLSGCASAPPAHQPLVRPAQAELLPFVLNGRIAVKHDEERTSASLHWTHRPAEDEIFLFAPLGQTVARINRDAQGVTLDASDKQYAAENTEDLTQKVLGWRLPLEGMLYWVLALPVPDGKASVEHDAGGQVSVIKQDGWEIHYTRYAAQTPDSLPLRLTLQREGVEIKFLIDEWDIK
jgi:outer membrane lipoprotein LolB